MPEKLPETTPAKPLPAPLTGKTILLVEDESFIADLLIGWLGRLGAITLWANTGQEGLRLLAANPNRICIVIADYRLPDINGDEMCAKMRELQPGLPVLLSSGRYHREAEATLAKSGPTRFIQKPYPLEEVLKKLQKLLSDVA